jgi:hypothetical protein
MQTWANGVQFKAQCNTKAVENEFAKPRVSAESFRTVQFKTPTEHAPEKKVSAQSSSFKLSLHF